MSPRIWRVSVFLLLFGTGFITAFVLLFLLGLFAGASWFVIVPLGGALLLFATASWVLLWPRLGSWLGLAFLICIVSWLIIAIVSDVAQRNFGDVITWIVLLVPVAAGLWFTSREALGFTRHVSPRPGAVYTAFAILLIAAPPVLVFAYLHSIGRPSEVREFPIGFRGDAIIVWAEPTYPPLPIRRGKLIEHFPADGTIITSTPNHEGWAYDELYFYDSMGHLSKEPGIVALASNGGINNIMQYSKIFVGTEEQDRKRPFDEKEQRIHDLFEKLHPASK